MKCPKCSGVMETQTAGDLKPDVCTQCGGLWFDQGELKESKDQADPFLRWMDFEIWKHQDQFRFADKAAVCPKCDRVMVTVNYGKTDVEIDYCPQCRGTWLDAGEFAKIIDELESEAANKSVSGYVLESLKEAKELVTGDESLVSEWKDFATVLKLLQYRFGIEHPDLQDTIIGIQKGFR